MKTNRNKHKVRPPSQAEMGLQSREAGKGDADRTTDRDAFRKNFPDLQPTMTEDGFVSSGPSRKIKSYGKRAQDPQASPFDVGRRGRADV